MYDWLVAFAANDPWAAKPADAWAGGAGGPPHTNGNNAFPHQPPAQAPGGGLDEAFDMIGTRSKSPSGNVALQMRKHIWDLARLFQIIIELLT